MLHQCHQHEIDGPFVSSADGKPYWHCKYCAKARREYQRLLLVEKDSDGKRVKADASESWYDAESIGLSSWLHGQGRAKQISDS